MKKIPTGISELDSVMGGGFPKGVTVLVCGNTGTGKTVFCTQFLYSGIVEHNEPGVLVLSEERASDLYKDMLSLGWDLQNHVHARKLVIIDGAQVRKCSSDNSTNLTNRALDINALITLILKESFKIGAKRLVIDSIPGLNLGFSKLLDFRKVLLELSFSLQESGFTSLMTSESINSYLLSRYGIEEFVTRGIIELSLKEEEPKLFRYLRVRKMCGSAHSMKKFPFEIRKGGIVLYTTK